MYFCAFWIATKNKNTKLTSMVYKHLCLHQLNYLIRDGQPSVIYYEFGKIKSC